MHNELKAFFALCIYICIMCWHVIWKKNGKAVKGLKEAEKMSDLASMKAKLIESNTSKERAQKIEKKDIPAQVKEIEEIEQKIANI